MFQYDEQVWTKGGQQLQEFWNSAEQHLKASMTNSTVHVRELLSPHVVCNTSLAEKDALQASDVLKVLAKAVLWVHTCMNQHIIGHNCNTS